MLSVELNESVTESTRYPAGLAGTVPGALRYTFITPAERVTIILSLSAKGMENVPTVAQVPATFFCSTVRDARQ